MSWSARLTHTTTGLAIVFAAPTSRLDMTPDVAAHFARLLAAEASLGVIGTLEAENRSRAVVMRESQKRLYIGSTDTSSHPLCCDCDPCLNGETR